VRLQVRAQTCLTALNRVAAVALFC
jgi:hypothetical protein